MKSIEMRAANPLVAMCAVLYAIACSGSGISVNFGDAAAENGSGNSSGSGGSSGSSNSSGSTGASASSSGSLGSGASSGTSGGPGSSSGSAGSSSSSGVGGDGATCTIDTDCDMGERCGFPKLAGCSATGSCFPAPGAICNAIVLACACDGTEINVACNGLPSDYAPKPFAHSEACGFDSGGGTSGSDGGSDGSGGRDAGIWRAGRTPATLRPSSASNREEAPISATGESNLHLRV